MDQIFSSVYHICLVWNIKSFVLDESTLFFFKKKQIFKKLNSLANNKSFAKSPGGERSLFEFENRFIFKFWILYLLFLYFSFSTHLPRSSVSHYKNLKFVKMIKKLERKKESLIINIYAFFQKLYSLCF